MDDRHQCCVVGARYDGRSGVRRSCSTGSKGPSFLTLAYLSSHVDEIQLMFAGDMFYVLTLFSSKLSVALFFHRLSASTEKTLFADILVYACAALGIISAFVIGLRQQLVEPWLQGTALGRSTVGDISWNNGSYSAADIDVATPLDCH